MKLLVVTPWFPNHPDDGRHQHVFRQVEALVHSGIVVHILVVRSWVPKFFGIISRQWRRGRIQHAAFDGFGFSIQQKLCVSLPRYILYGYQDLLTRLSLGKTFSKLLVSTSIDLVHIHTEQIGFVFQPICHQMKVPAIITLHAANPNPVFYNSDRKIKRLIDTLDGADKVVLVGKVLRDFFKTKGCSGDNFTVMPNGFHLPGKLAKCVSSKFGCDTIRLCSVSHLYESKGVMLNLYALKNLADEEMKNWEYHIVGDGVLRHKMEDYVHGHGLHDRVHFHGHLAHPKAMEIVSACDVFMLPSRNEAFGIVYLEAMALGLLTIGVQGQGPSDFIDHMQTGVLIDFDLKQLTDTLRKILLDKSRFECIAETGCRKVTTKYTWEQNASALVRLYDTVLEDHQLAN